MSDLRLSGKSSSLPTPTHAGPTSHFENESHPQERSRYDERLARLRKQNEELVNETAAIRRKFGQTLSLMPQYQEKLAALQRENETSSKELSGERQRVEEAQQQNSKLEEQNSKLGRERDQLRIELRELRAAQHVLQDENDQRGQKIRDIESEVRNTREKTKEAAKEFESERRQLLADKAEIQLHHRNLEERLAHERSVAAALSKQNDKLLEATQKATDLVVTRNSRDQSDGRSDKTRRSPGRRTAIGENSSSRVAGVPPAVVQSLQEELGMVRQHLRTLQQEVQDGANRPPQPHSSSGTVQPRFNNARRDIERLLMIQENSWSPSSRARKHEATSSSPRFGGGALSQIDNFDSLLDIVDSLET